MDPRRWPPGNLGLAVVSIDPAEPNPIERPTHSSLYQKGIGILIWLGFALAGIAALYACSFLAGD